MGCHGRGMIRFLYVSKLRAQTGLKFDLRQISNSQAMPSHYKTLGVNEASSQREIRDAYVRLSKIHHPDLGGSAEQFAALNQAYQILSNDSLKNNAYDATCSNPESFSARKRWPAEAEIFHRQPQEAPPSGTANYYGIKGVRKVSNGFIALICVVVVFVSGAVHLVAIQLTSRSRGEQVQRRTLMNQMHENHCREQYDALGQDEAIQRFAENVGYTQLRKT